MISRAAIDQLIAQAAAQEKARLTGRPTPDGHGSIWYPPGKDGIPIVGPDEK